MILQTERLFLREMTQADHPALSAILQDARVMRAYEGPFCDDDVQGWLDRQLARYREHGFGLWAVVLKETGVMIGQCGLTMQAVDGEQVPEIGYLLAYDFWHCGYATEAAIACREYAFHLGFGAVYSIIRDSNTASQRVAARNGMVPIGQFVKHYRGVDMPHIVYCVKKEQLPREN